MSHQSYFHFTSPTRSTAQTSAALGKAELQSKKHQPGFVRLLNVGGNNSWGCCSKFGVLGVFIHPGHRHTTRPVGSALGGNVRSIS